MGCILETPCLYGDPAQPLEELTPHFLQHLLLLTLSPKPQVSRNLLCQLSGTQLWVYLINLPSASTLNFHVLFPMKFLKNEWVNLSRLL